jgi:hypothetical protein
VNTAKKMTLIILCNLTVTSLKRRSGWHDSIVVGDAIRNTINP